MNAVKWVIACLAFTASLFSQAPTNGLSVYLPLNGTSTDLSGTGKQITTQGMTFASGPNWEPWPHTVGQSRSIPKIDFQKKCRPTLRPPPPRRAGPAEKLTKQVLR